jgi:subtilisin family serine protease
MRALGTTGELVMNKNPRRGVFAFLGLASVAASVLTVATPASAEGAPTSVDVLRSTATGLQVTTERAASPEAAQTLVQQLRGQSGVVSASISATRELFGSTHDDTLLSEAGYLQTIGATDSWAKASGRGVTVAVLDNGVDASHPELRGALLPQVNLLSSSPNLQLDTHGTSVAGTVAGRLDNAIGAAGVAPDASILPIRVCDVDGCDTDAIARGVIYATDHGATVINLSLGGQLRSSVEEAAIAYAVRKGVTVVASAGNGGSDCTEDAVASAKCGNLVAWPAAFPDVISVSAADATGVSAWATHNVQVDLSAPGEGIIAPAPGNVFEAVDGTSFSAPLVSGTVAAMLQVNPRLTPADVRNVLTSTSTKVASWPAGYGSGLLNVAAAVSKAGGDGVFQRTEGSVDYVRGGITTTVKGAILTRFRAAGAENGVLGWPTSGEIASAGGVYQVFTGGFVVWSRATGAQIMYGDNLPRWLTLGGTTSKLGFPSSEEIRLTSGVVQRFTGGNMYWSPASGSQEVRGAIFDKYSRLGWENSFLGYPTTNEVALKGGAFSAFEGGAIYWSPGTGAHFVRDAIRQAWGSTGWESGYLGYPTSDEYSWNGGVRQDFQGRSLFFSWQTGLVTEVR